MRRGLLIGALSVLAACSGGSGTGSTPSISPTAESPSVAASAVPTITAPMAIPDPPTTKTSICDDAHFWASFINDAESGSYDQSQVSEELRAFLPKLQRDVLAAGGTSTQAALAKLVPAGTAVLADNVGSSNWNLDLALFGLDLKTVLKYLPNCQ